MKNLEKYLIDFDTLKVGDKVWTIQEGDTEVIKLRRNGEYSIYTKKQLYTKEGYFVEQHKSPSLFKSNPFENISEYPKVMEVSDDKDFKIGNFEKRIVLGKNINGYISVFNNINFEDIKINDEIIIWKYAREIQKKKTRLTMEDIAKLANIDVKDLEIVK